MQIIKLNATDSTNLYLKDLMNLKPLDDLTLVMADEQAKGRGQMGTIWESEPGKNLTFSVLKKMDTFAPPNFFILNICVSLAIYETLKRILVPDLHIKWPNDILSGNSKICGILIENIVSGNRIQASVIGIGLNVNQTTFTNLTNVSSLKLLLGRTIDLDLLLDDLHSELGKTFIRYGEVGPIEMQREYEEVLFRKDKPSTFKDNDGKIFMGFIRGVSPEGKLIVTLEGDIQKAFIMKEISLLY